jgi:hypothetical protein
MGKSILALDIGLRPGFVCLQTLFTIMQVRAAGVIDQLYNRLKGLFACHLSSFDALSHHKEEILQSIHT